MRGRRTTRQRVKCTTRSKERQARQGATTTQCDRASQRVEGTACGLGATEAVCATSSWHLSCGLALAITAFFPSFFSGSARPEKTRGVEPRAQNGGFPRTPRDTVLLFNRFDVKHRCFATLPPETSKRVREVNDVLSRQPSTMTRSAQISRP